MKAWVRGVGGLFLGAASLGLLNYVNQGEPQPLSRQEDLGFGPQEVWRSASPLSRSAKVEKNPGAPTSWMDVGVNLKSSPPPPPPPDASLPSQRLIRSGSFSLEVAKFDEATAELGRIAQAAHGYVADTRQERRSSGSYRGELTMRIPAENFGGTGGAVRKLGKVLNESSQVQDITKAYMDVEAKLAVRTEASRRVRELLRGRTGNLKEILEAEKELARLQEEIEELEGERRFYAHQVRLTTLRVELAEPETISLARPSHWSALRSAAGDIAYLLAGSLAALLRLLVVVLPWILLGWLGWTIARRVRALRKPFPSDV